ncbi:hypothetical protein [Vulcaniibacterium gelatinicum]|uniref:hypothetical protein n=1 Tax=Vulcaniibacterium gelatinicum TaxID=2598725 RepID=UPI0011C97814|nr:hypothetical protein [Vulcaniibacterium gelatinicum]
MPATPSMFRLVVLAVLALAVATGCSWFRRGKDPYAMSPESRPLEVPPDLDLPRTDGAMRLPPAAQATASAPAAASTGFTVSGSRDEVFQRVGEALAGIEGVTIASGAQLLGAYDLSYQGANFLVRVSAAEGGVYVSAVDPRGLPATGEAPVRLMAALKAALGGN